MCKNRLMYLASLAGVLIFHTYYTGWFSWYLLMLTVTLPWFSLLCSLSPMLRLRIAAPVEQEESSPLDGKVSYSSPEAALSENTIAGRGTRPAQATAGKPPKPAATAKPPASGTER